MLPWVYALLSVVILCSALTILSLAGYLPFWFPAILTLAMLAAYFVWEKGTKRIDARWGEGARGEFQVGAELERLHKEGFHVFHDWDSGMGNVGHFVVGTKGIFAVETKAWAGEITGRRQASQQRPASLRQRPRQAGRR